MFSTFKQRLLLGIYVFVILSIPVAAFLVSQNQTVKSSASEGKAVVKTTPRPAGSPNNNSPSKDLLKLSQSNLPTDETLPTPIPEPSSTIATSYGPTLSLKAHLEGRPAQNQATKLFVGIIEGDLLTNPKFLLSFTVDLPANGVYDNLSLAGLNSGTKYTALLKGSAQIATSSAFIMSPTVSNLNDGQPINLLTGDLNEDNVINSTDYDIALKALGTSSTSSNWNELVDFNKDGIINLFDLSIISKNLGQTGTSGAWTSLILKAASPSGSLANTSSNPQGGYWLWIPK